MVTMTSGNLHPRHEDAELAEDTIRGIKKIAKFVGAPERQVFNWAECGYIPVGKLGATWIASKRALRAHFAKLTGAEAA